MSAAAGGCAVLQFTTDTVPERDRATVVRDFYGPLAARVDFEPDPRERLYFEAVARALPDLTISNLAFSALRAERTRELAADGNDSCIFSVLRSSGTAAVCRGREATPAEGAATLLSMADPFVCTSTARIARGITLSVPRKVLAASVPRTRGQLRAGVPEFGGAAAARKLRRRVGAGPSVGRPRPVPAGGDARARSHCACSRRLERRRRDRQQPRVARRAPPRHQGRHPCLTRQARSQPVGIATRHGITPRYVQALFADEGATFSQFLLDERLARVHRMLRSPLHPARRTSDIAFDAGFGDLSYFNRAFRRRYGATPSDVRAAAKRERSE